MGKADIATKAYMRKNHVFADAFNYLIYDGESVVDPEHLKELDIMEMALPLDVLQGDKGGWDAAVQKYRDILKAAVIMEEETAAYVLLGIENQTDIHYAMPVRTMIYDALQYGKQVTDTAERHKRKENAFRGHTKAEYLSGFYKTDKLKPVITLVIHFGADEWDAPLSLHEMMEINDGRLLSFVQDYKIHLIDPAKISETDFVKFSSSLREVMEYIKYSGDRENLQRILKDNPRMVMEREAAIVIKTVTNTQIQISEERDTIDMCEAIESMLMESKERGIEQGIEQGVEIGEFRMLVRLVREGDLKIERAAVKAKLSVEQFKERMAQE